MKRCLEPEWLDELPPFDPRAIKSRRDLRRINMLMMNPYIISRKLECLFRGRSPSTIAEIGAGDGTFMLRLAKKTTVKNIHALLLDRRNIISDETRAQFGLSGWKVDFVTADVFEWAESPVKQVFDVIIANLFLHHFDDMKLTNLLASLAKRTSVFIATEPRRSIIALTGSRLLGLLGCNDVTRHDALTSVRAGFSNHELSALWPTNLGWALHEGASGLFTHCFVASRAEAVENNKK
jgi:hypothetical protein